MPPKSRPRILFLSCILPYPNNIGTVLRSLSMIHALEQVADLEFQFFGHSTRLFESDFAQNRRLLPQIPPPTLSLAPLLDRIKAGIGQAGNHWLDFYLPGFHRLYRNTHWAALRAHIARSRPDAFFVVQSETLWWLPGLDPARTILDVDTLRHVGLKPTRALPGQMAKHWVHANLKHAELSAIRRARHALVCSEDDRQALGEGNLVVLPNIPPAFGALAPDSGPALDSKTILFVGTTTYVSNVEGIDYFVRRILPLIRARDPQIRFVVIGKTSPGARFAWAQADGVDFHGTVEDTAPYIRAAAIEVCPLLSGTGTRIKILESLSLGVPVVSTTLGAYGIDLGETHGVFRVDGEQAFADTCLALIADRARRAALFDAARAGVEQRYSQVGVNRTLAGLVENVVGSAG